MGKQGVTPVATKAEPSPAYATFDNCQFLFGFYPRGPPRGSAPDHSVRKVHLVREIQYIKALRSRPFTAKPATV